MASIGEHEPRGMQVRTIEVPQDLEVAIAVGFGEIISHWGKDPLIVPNPVDQMSLFETMTNLQPNTQARVVGAIVGIDDLLRERVKLPRRTEVVHSRLGVLNHDRSSVDVGGLTVVGSIAPIVLNIHGSGEQQSFVHEGDRNSLLLCAGAGQIALANYVSPGKAPKAISDETAVVIQGRLRHY